MSARVRSNRFHDHVCNRMHQLTAPATLDEVRKVTGGDRISVAGAMQSLVTGERVQASSTRPVRYCITAAERSRRVTAGAVPLPAPGALLPGSMTPFGLVCGGVR